MIGRQGSGSSREICPSPFQRRLGRLARAFGNEAGNLRCPKGAGADLGRQPAARRQPADRSDAHPLVAGDPLLFRRLHLLHAGILGRGAGQAGPPGRSSTLETEELKPNLYFGETPGGRRAIARESELDIAGSRRQFRSPQGLPHGFRCRSLLPAEPGRRCGEARSRRTLSRSRENERRRYGIASR